MVLSQKAIALINAKCEIMIEIKISPLKGSGLGHHTPSFEKASPEHTPILESGEKGKLQSCKYLLYSTDRWSAVLSNCSVVYQTLSLSQLGPDNCSL